MNTRLTKLAVATVGAVAIAATAVPADAYWRVAHRPNRTIVVSRSRPLRTVVVVAGRPGAVIDFNVKPKATRIWVDGTYRGTCAEFDGHPQKMTLRPGTHRIKLVTPDGDVVYRSVSLIAGYEFDLNLDL